MALTFGISGLFGSIKAAGRKKAVGRTLSRAAALATPFINKTGADLKRRGEEDWKRFKETYRPAADALVADANRAPETERYETDVAVGTEKAASTAGNAIRRDASRSGAGVGSGSFAARSAALGDEKARSQGIGLAMAKNRANQEKSNKQLAVIDLGRDDPSSTIAGLGIVTKGGREYGKYAGAIGRSATESLGGAAQGAGQAIGSAGRGRGQTTFVSRDYNNSGQPDYVYGSGGQATSNEFNSQNREFGLEDQFADGGLIVGPGSGRSDSIPASIDGDMPARVSNGEYHISEDVVQRFGKERLDILVGLAR